MQKEPIFLASWKWHFLPSSMAEKIMIRERPAIRMTHRASNRSGVTDSAIWVSRTGPQGPFIQQNHAKSTHFSHKSWKWHFLPSSMAEKIMIRDRPAIRMTQRASNRSRVTDSAIWVSRTGPLGPFIRQNHAKSTHFHKSWKWHFS